jgi:beta-glucanase (GH16 family)
MKTIIISLIVFCKICIGQQYYFGKFNFIDDRNFELILDEQFTNYPNNSLNNLWDFEVGPSGNNVNEPYLTNRPANAQITSNNTLKMRVLKENYMGKNYTSANLTAKQIIPANSYIECSAKLPNYGKNPYAAFWLWGGDGSNSACNDYREIDIIEQMGDYTFTNNYSDLTGAIHFCNGKERAQYKQQSKYYPDQISNFHTYSCWWGKDKITLYKDNDYTKEYKEWPYAHYSIKIPTPSFKNNMFLVLQNKICNPDQIDSQRGSWDFEIDYVKVWHIKEDCNTIEFVNQPINASNFRWGLKKAYYFENTILNSSIFSPWPRQNKDMYFHATDYYEFGQNVEIQNTTFKCEFFFDVCN